MSSLLGNPTSLLKQYWGYDSFRPQQQEIVQSVLEGHDTLALLPTGGGKSVCFQVPAMAMEGICIVVSPLIALIKDQVENLDRIGVKALAVYSGMSSREIDVALDNAAYGGYKFLYLSPERLETELFLERAKKMKVSLLAIDEAHCISEWGYDFRPSYLKIAAIRDIFPDVPMLALTASATLRVRNDICEKLAFRKGYKVFSRSFDRPNLIYAILKEEDKRGRMLKLFEKVKGTGIVYVGTRRETKEYAEFLSRQGVSADYYHGGLNLTQRTAKQEQWKNNTTRVMVCTNAFGMGIDKPDVRLVVHYTLPDSLEAYYQEAGRAGRDLKRSFAIGLVNDSDKVDFEKKIELTHPSVEVIRHVYHALGNFFQLPEGAGEGQSYPFDIGEFCRRYEMNSQTVYSALKSLESSGYITFSEAVFLPSRCMFTIDHEEVYGFEIANKKYEPVIKTILRSYGGAFQEYVKIDESQIASRTGMQIREVVAQLHELTNLEVLDYQQQTNDPQITFLTERLSRSGLYLDVKELRERKEIYASKVGALLKYAFAEERCRTKILLDYFGEQTDENCGHCDYCLKKDKPSVKEQEVRDLHERIFSLLSQGPRSLAQVIGELKEDETVVVNTLRWMLDRKMIRWEGEAISLNI